MDIKHLITFTSFAKKGSYNQVAQELNYSVSTLVAHIASLEEEFEVELIHTQGRKSQLTEAGRAFLPFAEKIISIYQAAYVAMGAFRGISGDLKIAVSETVGLYQLSSIYSKFSKFYPQVNLTVHITSQQYVVRQLYDHSADVVFSQSLFPLQVPDIRSILLYNEPLVLVAPPRHPLSRIDKIHAADLKHQILLFPRQEYLEHPAIKQVLENSHATVDKNLFLDSGILMKQMVCQRRCLTFLQYSCVKKEIESGELIQLPWADAQILMPVYAFYMEKSFQLPAIEALVSFVRENIKDIYPKPL